MLKFHGEGSIVVLRYFYFLQINTSSLKVKSLISSNYLRAWYKLMFERAHLDISNDEN